MLKCYAVAWSLRASPLNWALVLDWHHGKFFGVYRVLFLSLHLVKCAFHVLSGGTICDVLALTSPFTVSNVRAISLVWFL